LLPEAISRTLQVLQEYYLEMKQMEVDEFRVVATSAVREAENAQEFVDEAGRIGLDVEVITGENEARLSFVGATRGLAGVKDPTVLDIGGGSTEFIWEEHGLLRSFSLPLGAVRLTENPTVPLDTQDALVQVFALLKERRESFLVGVGGTITTLAAIELGLIVYQPELVHGYVLRQKAVQQILEHLASLSFSERQQVAGLQPERADIIIAGGTLLLHIMERTGRTEIIVSESDLLQGLIWKMAICN
jgi:exopolyphosphatase/guanosine-5'-triphosphate,3'-diphosphate pyrophosphatase